MFQSDKLIWYPKPSTVFSSKLIILPFEYIKFGVNGSSNGYETSPNVPKASQNVISCKKKSCDLLKILNKSYLTFFEKNNNKQTKKKKQKKNPL